MEDNKRATKGTEHTLQTSQKIGGEFTKQENAPFIKERAEIWDKFYSAQEEKNKLIISPKYFTSIQKKYINNIALK